MRVLAAMILGILVASAQSQVMNEQWNSRAPASVQTAPAAPRLDTTIVTTIRGGDTTTVVTIHQNDPAHNIDRTLKNIFALQVALVLVNVASAVILLIAMP